MQSRTNPSPDRSGEGEDYAIASLEEEVTVNSIDPPPSQNEEQPMWAFRVASWLQRRGRGRGSDRPTNLARAELDKPLPRYDPTAAATRPLVNAGTPEGTKGESPSGSEKLVDSDGKQTNPSEKDTVLYLAYGSNLSASAFRVRRGIRPLSAVNVVVPELELVFDLPGIPYTEPCFANSRVRTVEPAPPPPPEPLKDLPAAEEPYSHPTPGNGVGKVSKASFDGENAVKVDEEEEEEESSKRPLLPAMTDNGPQSPPPLPSSSLGWTKGLVGTVYEVTKADYGHIIATEGGGTSYADIQVSCFPLDDDPNKAVPEHPERSDSGSVGVPFRAHTLCATLPLSRRRREAYAQPSRRYLGLLIAGAAENGIPLEYRTWLSGLQPYTITTLRQKLGKVVLSVVWSPAIMLLLGMGRMFSDERGRAPAWLSAAFKLFFGLVWKSYDYFFRPVFGDGERTQGT